ncbi:arsenical pump-driving ATPase [Burkholderia sp. SIMBA_043]|uniref:arsenical pump-driving ATPase n=2 Tax=Burkholderiales TaxID=80840 RepID=UPI0005D8027D|nr:arsenical pump-driving ATPase [Burkholderia vietnamiensis]AJY08649.1 arsenical pump-driving ATPase [Burkholderia vietnamiensis LMG 10929]AVR14823.1 arsenical pump-driving ATPase [Burkholderia vietnamiensis]KVF14448.1 arsenical pump-driving ATPase [Burkholderia vietnamiensis]KVF72743.1 arsenical pump-driving ATPase [Burkholderia vietnamiensis]KVF80047.1 arsenical pump-driving ATPase [Burkholderia vietnamiensis]
MSLPDTQTRYLFFTGKGGVGKTSLSCATGVAMADVGRKVLIVSTDPASNLDEVLGVGLSQLPTAVPGAPGLFALNIDPEAAAHAYRERMVGPYRGVLPAAAIRSMEEQFSGACTVEIAAFDEFSKLLGNPSATADFDHVIFDTAPTGHTLRLLTLPSAWNEFISSSTGGASCLGPLAGLEKQKALYAATVERLSSATETTVVLVSRPEVAALREANRTRHELAELGIRNQMLAINGLFTTNRHDDAIATAMAERAQQALADMPRDLACLPQTRIPFLPRGTVGLDALRDMAQPERVRVPTDCRMPATTLPPGLGGLVDELSSVGHGVIMTMGKGGVGKTTVAAAIAVALARKGHPVVLSTTDPAAHVAATIDGVVPGLTVTRIDPALEVRQYTEDVLAKAGTALDAGGRAMLEEDLRSPCTEEIAVFRAFARAVDQGKSGFVVLDTAPTGHTILLLDAAEAYHREVMRTQGDMPEPVRQLLPRLRDPDYTRILIVTLPEATPVHEAERLSADLARAGIEPYAWVINQSLLASGTTDPMLCQRGTYEVPFVRRVADDLAPRAALIPWLAEAPVGEAGLEQVITSRMNA